MLEFNSFMSVAGENILLPEDYEIMKEIILISNKEMTNFQFMLIVNNLDPKFSHVRVKCLQVIGQIGDPISHFPCGTSNPLDIMEWYTQDDDSRARETAFGWGLQWLERGFSLPNFELIYDLWQTGLTVDKDEVVITCSNLVVNMANVKSDLEMINSTNQKRSCLADRSLCCVGCAISHVSSSVRREAAFLLSSIKDVSESLMLETMEKTVMKGERANCALCLMRSFDSICRPGSKLDLTEDPAHMTALGRNFWRNDPQIVDSWFKDDHGRTGSYSFIFLKQHINEPLPLRLYHDFFNASNK